MNRWTWEDAIGLAAALCLLAGTVIYFALYAATSLAFMALPIVLVCWLLGWLP